MPKAFLVKAALCCVFCCLAAPLAKAAENPVVIGLIGDSTVASTYGWGPAFAAKTDSQVTVLNYARNGATLDSLAKSLGKLLAKKPHYVLIQFGHNDMKRYDPTAYQTKLTRYLDQVAKSGAQAVVLSSVTRRNFGDDNKIAPAVINGRTLADYAKAARTAAKQARVPFIDLNAISINHHNDLGPVASTAYNFQETDKTHFSKAGAEAIAAIVIRELKSAVPELSGRFR